MNGSRHLQLSPILQCLNLSMEGDKPKSTEDNVPTTHHGNNCLSTISGTILGSGPHLRETRTHGGYPAHGDIRQKLRHQPDTAGHHGFYGSMAGIQRVKHSFNWIGPSGGCLRRAPRPLCLLLCIKGGRGLRDHTVGEGGPRCNSVFELCFAR